MQVHYQGKTYKIVHGNEDDYCNTNHPQIFVRLVNIRNPFDRIDCFINSRGEVV